VKAPNTDESDSFGGAVALSGDGAMLAVSAPYEASNAVGIGGDMSNNDTGGGAGAAYVFRQTAGTWGFEAYVKASNTDAEDFFGARLAVSADGETLVCSATGEASIARGIGGDAADNSASFSGAVYIY